MSQSNKMSVMQLTVLTAVNMMGSGIIMLPSKLAQVGALSIVSWLVTAVGSMCLAGQQSPMKKSPNYSSPFPSFSGK